MLRKTFICAMLNLAYLHNNAQVAQVLTDSSTSKSVLNETAAEKKLLISGSIDLFHKWNGFKTNVNNYTSFTSSERQFALGMASVKLEHQGEKIGAVIDLGIGNRATEFAYNDVGLMQAVKQMYVSYNPATWVKLTAGTWATHVGYELLDPQLNKNYSMSYMFTNGPFSHIGLKAEFAKNKSAIMIGVANPTDYRLLPSGFIHKKFALAQYTYTASDEIKYYINYVGGKNLDTSIANQFDVVGTFNVSKKWYLALNATVATVNAWGNKKYDASKAWSGAALYLTYTANALFNINWRTEYFNDKNQLKTFLHSSNGGKIWANTLSANFKKGGFTLIPEIRYDAATNKNLFLNNNYQPIKTNANFLLAIVYAF